MDLQPADQRPAPCLADPAAARSASGGGQEDSVSCAAQRHPAELQVRSGASLESADDLSGSAVPPAATAAIGADGLAGRSVTSGGAADEIRSAPGGATEQFKLLLAALVDGRVPAADGCSVIFDVLVGGRFDLESNFVIRHDGTLSELLKIIVLLPEKLQAELWSVLSGLLRKSRRNLVAGAAADISSYILRQLPSTRPGAIADLMLDALDVVATYSISAAELRLLLANMSTPLDCHTRDLLDIGCWPPHAPKLMQILAGMPRRHGPDEFFSFCGQQGSAIALPPVSASKWPYLYGWTFSTWLYLDPLASTSVDQGQPYVYCFQTKHEVGHSARFLGSVLVVTTNKSKGKGQQHCVQYNFEPRKWYMVTIAHVYSRWRSASVKCYVDGQLVSGGDLAWPVSPSEPFDKCYFGNAADLSREHAFSGQMAAVYVFGCALEQAVISALYQLGPGYKSHFEFENECPAHLPEKLRKAIYDGKLTESIVLMYSPAACDSHVCLESSPRGNAGVFVHSPAHAVMTKGVKAVVTHSVFSALHSLGGLHMVYPFFGQLTCGETSCSLLYNGSEAAGSAAPSSSIGALLMSFLCDMVESSIAVLQQLALTRGFQIISHCLEKASPCHLSREVLACFVRLVNYISSVPNGGALFKQLHDHVIFNYALWSRAPFAVQLALYEYTATDYLSVDTARQLFSSAANRTRAIVLVLHSLKSVHSLVASEKLDSKAEHADSPSETRVSPTSKETMRLRGCLLLFIDRLIARCGIGILDVEMEAVVNYLTVVQEEDDLFDVLYMCLSFVRDYSSTAIPAFDLAGGMTVVFKLLRGGPETCSEPMRLLSLKLLGCYLASSSTKRKQETIMTHNLFGLLTEFLLSKTTDLTMALYNVLLEILLDKVGKQVVLLDKRDVDGSLTIENPALLKVIAELIERSKQTDECKHIREIFLKDIFALCKNNVRNKRCILQLPIWQEWLFSLLHTHPRSHVERHVTGLVLAVAHMLIVHAVKHEFGGWCVWIDSMALLHYKICREEYKIYATAVQAGHILPRHSAADEAPGGSARSSPEPAAAPGSSGSSACDTDRSAVSGAVGAAAEGAAAEGAPTSTDSPSSAPSPGCAEPELPRRSSVPRFQIADFYWSSLHQYLLSDLIGFMEQEVASWRMHPEKTLTTIINEKENAVFVANSIHLICHLSDVLINASGGLLPLLSATTSGLGAIDVLEPGYGLTLQDAVVFLLRVCLLADVLVSGSSVPLTDLEGERSLKRGAMVRQCMRLVCACAVRNCLECVWLERGGAVPTEPLSLRNGGGRHPDPVAALVEGARALAASEIAACTGGVPLVEDSRLALQEHDTVRMRSLMDRCLDEDSKVAEKMALVVVFFVSSIMVAKYKHLLESLDLHAPLRRSSAGEVAAASPAVATAAAAAEATAACPLPAEAPVSTDGGTATTVARSELCDRCDAGCPGSEPPAAPGNRQRATAVADDVAATGAGIAVDEAPIFQGDGHAEEYTSFVGSASGDTGNGNQTYHEESPTTLTQSATHEVATAAKLFQNYPADCQPAHDDIARTSHDNEPSMDDLHFSSSYKRHISADSSATGTDNGMAGLSSGFEDTIMVRGPVAENLDAFAMAVDPGSDFSTARTCNIREGDCSVANGELLLHTEMSPGADFANGTCLGDADGEAEEGASLPASRQQCSPDETGAGHVGDCVDDNNYDDNEAASAEAITVQPTMAARSSAQEAITSIGASVDSDVAPTELVASGSLPVEQSGIRSEAGFDHYNCGEALFLACQGTKSVADLVDTAAPIIRGSDEPRVAHGGFITALYVPPDVDASEPAAAAVVLAAATDNGTAVSVAVGSPPATTHTLHLARADSSMLSFSDDTGATPVSSLVALCPAKHPDNEPETACSQAPVIDKAQFIHLPSHSLGICDDDGTELSLAPQDSATPTNSSHWILIDRCDPARRTPDCEDDMPHVSECAPAAVLFSQTTGDDRATADGEASPRTCSTASASASSHSGGLSDSVIYASAGTATDLDDEHTSRVPLPWSVGSVGVALERVLDAAQSSHTPCGRPGDANESSAGGMADEAVVPWKETADPADTSTCVATGVDLGNMHATPMMSFASFSEVNSDRSPEPDGSALVAQWPPPSVYGISAAAATADVLRTLGDSASSTGSGTSKSSGHRLPHMDSISSEDAFAYEVEPAKQRLTAAEDVGISDGSKASVAKDSPLSITLEQALRYAAPYLKEVMLDFLPYLTRHLVGSKGQTLLVSSSLAMVRDSQSWSAAAATTELVMMLCSREWQVALQKHAALAFIELVNEGRLLAHAMRHHFVKVAREGEAILLRLYIDDTAKHAQFKALCKKAEQRMSADDRACISLLNSARTRDKALAVRLVDELEHLARKQYGGALLPLPAGAAAVLPTTAYYTDVGRRAVHLKLDTWEDRCRRRRRFVPNPRGSSHPEATLAPSMPELGFGSRALPGDGGSQLHELAVTSQQLTDGDTSAAADASGSLANPDVGGDVREEQDGDADHSGATAFITACKLVSCTVIINGMLSIGRNELYFEMDDDDDENNKLNHELLAYIEPSRGHWHFTDVCAIASRRYLLQNVGLEIFFASHASVLFVFESQKVVKQVVNLLPRVGPGPQYGLPCARRMSLAAPMHLFKVSDMTQRWRRREISNFEYLMYLNTIAGRSYNDLNQYPVFPWVLSNYDGKELDLSQPSNYRDLSKPVGALNPLRKAFFEERYASWEQTGTGGGMATSQAPPFHYGTHYSTAAYVLNWLVRLEPFTTAAVSLYDGKFDHANRIFSSVSAAWSNCQRDTSDVKEVIPEFYFLPEMFVNSNGLKLGHLEDGSTVDDVVLPPWAKDPNHFVHVSRQALESEVVSCQLHEWIDLVFGYKQRGPEAVRATNVFYYLTYEGSIDLSSCKDPVIREAAENQIRSFGQTPAQLLTEPHPPRGSVMHVAPRMFTPVRNDICMSAKFLTSSPVVHLTANTCTTPQHSAPPAVVAVFQNRTFAVNRWISDPPPASVQPSSAGSAVQGMSPVSRATADKSHAMHMMQPTAAAVHSHVSTTTAAAAAVTAHLPLELDPVLSAAGGDSKRVLGDHFDERLHLGHDSVCVSQDSQCIVVCGFWDKSFRVYSSATGKAIQAVFGHYDVVSCLSLSEADGYMGNASAGTGHRPASYLVTGSWDCTCFVWLWHSSGLHQQSASPLHSCIVRADEALQQLPTDGGLNPSPLAVLHGHQAPLISCRVSAELGLVASLSKDGSCFVHTLAADLLHTLDVGVSAPTAAASLGDARIRQQPASLLLIPDTYSLVVYGGSHLAKYSLSTGQLLLQQDLGAELNVLCATASRDGLYLVVGGSSSKPPGSGFVSIIQAHDLATLHRYPACSAAVRDVTLSHNHKNVIAGVGCGAIVVYNVDFSRWHHDYRRL